MLPADETTVTVATADEISGSTEITIVDGIAAIRSEHVILAAVDLPLPRASQRRQALPFAMEDMVSQPLDTLHFALGERLADGRWLAAAVDRALMQRWTAGLAALGESDAAIVPDILALPVPQPGRWSVETLGGRVLVRTEDGAGFATRSDLLPMFWEQAGRPLIDCGGDALPDMLPIAERRLLTPFAGRLAGAAFDLRGGAFGPARPALAGYWRTAMAATAAGLAAHAAIAAADTFALASIAEARRDEVSTLIALARPDADIDADLITASDRLLSSASGSAQSALPLLSRISVALLPLKGAVRFETLGYAGADTPTRLLLTARDRASYDRAAMLLRGAGLSVRASMAVPVATGVRGDFTLSTVP